MLPRLQSDLQQIYRLDHFPSIEKFLISQKLLKQLFPAEREKQGSRVLVRQDASGLELAVYIERRALHPLKQNSPLTGSTQNCFLQVAEELSHFVYLLWLSANQRRTSLLNLELQAELDKFILLYFLSHQSRQSSSQQDNANRLFFKERRKADLGRQARNMYAEAERLAGIYRIYLYRRYIRHGRIGRLLAELRHFYRLPEQDRIKRVSNLPPCP